MSLSLPFACLLLCYCERLVCAKTLNTQRLFDRYTYCHLIHFGLINIFCLHFAGLNCKHIISL